MVCYENVFLVVVYVKRDFVLAHLWDAVAFSRDGMVWFIKTWKNTTWFTGILSSEHLQLCFRTAGAYFVFVSRQIKEEFKVQSKSQSPPPRDSDDSPPPLHPGKLSASCPPFWHCKQSLSDLAEACKCAPSRCAHGLRRSARSWWTSPAAHTQTHSLVPFLPHLPWSQGPAATQPLDSLTIECSLYPSSRLLTHHTFSIISRCGIAAWQPLRPSQSSVL